MPVAPTYPGVYIEEVPSGIRTITGVPTAITAFVGRARRGPLDHAVTVSSFAEFERGFGGLWQDSTMSYAVRAFFQNGGGRALIVRVAREATPATIFLGPEAEEAAEEAAEGEAAEEAPEPPVGALVLVASSPGAWGNELRAGLDHDTADPDDDSLFNLTVTEPGGVPERHLNVSLDETHPRYVVRVLEEDSELVRIDVDSDDAPLVPEDRPGVIASRASNQDGTDGEALTGDEVEGTEAGKTGLFALEKADLFNLLCIPPPTRDADGYQIAAGVYATALSYCVRRRAMLLVDSSPAWREVDDVLDGIGDLGLSGTDARNAALFFPGIRGRDPELENRLRDFAPSGAVAGVFARTDAQRGVWKAPAGIDAGVSGALGVSVSLTDDQIGQLNPRGVNCIKPDREFGTILWGSRTMRGADAMADDYKYVPVRRLALFIEESLFRGTQWVVFEPNAEPLWSQIRLNVGAFMQNLFRQGAFSGTSPRDAYFVKCDKETTTPNDQNLGMVNIVVGFAPLRPAEFVIIKIQQIVQAEG